MRYSSTAVEFPKKSNIVKQIPMQTTSKTITPIKRVRVTKEVRELCPKLESKINQAIKLLRKAESLACAYNPEGFYLSFSGGKDSQVVMHLAKMAHVKFIAHYCPTTVDHPEAIKFIRQHYPETVFDKVQQNIYSLAIKKHTLPQNKLRWCCEEYKEHNGAGNVVLVGVRHQESVNRARRNTVEITNHRYSGDIDGLSDFHAKMSQGQRKRHHSISIIDDNGERVLGCINGRESIVISPIIEWSELEVWVFLKKLLKLPVCSVYATSRGRVGCLCCILSRTVEMKADLREFPHIKKNWIRVIKTLLLNGYYKSFNKEFPDLTLAEKAEMVLEWWISKQRLDKWLEKHKNDKVE